MVECNFVELVDLLNSDRACCLEAAWIIEDISLIRDSFSFISFDGNSIPLRCNRAALTLAGAAKENDVAIIWLEECFSFIFLIVQHDFIE